MIILITGLPGHGKTLYSIDMIHEYLLANRPVFAQIDGLSINGVLPAPDDWTTTPTGSVVIYDEAQRIFPPTGATARTDRKDITEMETHRHTGHDIILITQNPKLIHAHVRRLVGRHYHVKRQMGMKYARVFISDEVMNIESPAVLKLADSKVWNYPTKNFTAYKSAEIHTKTFRLDTRIKFALISMFVLIGVVGLLLSRSMNFFTSTGMQEQTTETIQDQPAPASYAFQSQPKSTQKKDLAWIDQNWALTETAATVKGCIATSTRCRCYDQNGLPLVLDTAECLRRIDEPLPISIPNLENTIRREPDSSAQADEPAHASSDRKTKA